MIDEAEEVVELVGVVLVRPISRTAADNGGVAASAEGVVGVGASGGGVVHQRLIGGGGVVPGKGLRARVTADGKGRELLHRGASVEGGAAAAVRRAAARRPNVRRRPLLLVNRARTAGTKRHFFFFGTLCLLF